MTKENNYKTPVRIYKGKREARIGFIAGSLKDTNKYSTHRLVKLQNGGWAKVPLEVIEEMEPDLFGPNS